MQAGACAQAQGEWTQDERRVFLEIARMHGAGDKWGLFASHLRQRVGCEPCECVGNLRGRFILHGCGAHAAPGISHTHFNAQLMRACGACTVRLHCLFMKWMWFCSLAAQAFPLPGNDMPSGHAVGTSAARSTARWPSPLATSLTHVSV